MPGFTRVYVMLSLGANNPKFYHIFKFNILWWHHLAELIAYAHLVGCKIVFEKLGLVSNEYIQRLVLVLNE